MLGINCDNLNIREDIESRIMPFVYGTVNWLDETGNGEYSKQAEIDGLFLVEYIINLIMENKIMLGFRVWGIKENKFVENESYYYFWQESTGELQGEHGDPARNVFNVKIGDRYTEDKSLYIAMQSTGIRSGSEIFPTGRMYDYIYEKDIVKINSTELNVEYSFLVKSIPQFYSMLPGKTVKFIIIIIGNSFENPELLEKVRC